MADEFSQENLLDILQFLLEAVQRFAAHSVVATKVEVNSNEHQYLATIKTWKVACPCKISAKFYSSNSSWVGLQRRQFGISTLFVVRGAQQPYRKRFLKVRRLQNLGLLCSSNK